jgi:hypothetical protein
MGNKTFLGSVENNQPEQVELPGAAAGILPGNLLLRTDDEFEIHDGAGAAGFVYVAKEAPHGDIDTAYLEGETVFSYRPKSGDFYQMLVATGQALAVDTPLTSNGAGLLRIAVIATEPVVCYSDETITTTATTPVAVKFK